MSVENFEPKRFNRPVEQILPEEPPDFNLKQAREECSQAIDELSADINGIGPKAAERYLLRFEYGFATDTLTEHYEITKSTLSKQTNQVHRKVLKYPNLARVVGRFRAERAALNRPDSSNRTLWEETLDLHSKQIFTAADYRVGDLTTPYSWKIDLKADLALEGKTRRLECSYMVDEEYGVLLKRILKGISKEEWGERFRYEQLRTLEIYPLPHPKVPNSDGGLLDGLAYHVSYDIKSSFEDPAWGSIEKMIGLEGARDSAFRPIPEHAMPEMVTGERTSREQVRKYSGEVHRRDNFEHLLRVYPYTRVENIPTKTVDLLWNGYLSNDEKYLETIFRTSDPHYHPGSHRTIWALEELNSDQ